MSFKISQGLFRDNFTDYHAILGVPLDASSNETRKRYMRIARRLHPDSSRAESPEEQKLASDLFSKLVNPAYTKLSSDRGSTEHGIVLKSLAKRLAEERDSIQFQTEAAKQLLQTKDIEADYKKAVLDLAKQEYESFAGALDIIGQISELNLAYLLRSPARKSTAASQSPQKPAPAGAKSASTKAATPAKPEVASASNSRVDGYYRRAQEFIDSEDFKGAVIELKQAIKIEPKNSRCHALLGMAYLKQNQPTLAKIHTSQALKLKPEEPVALATKKQLEGTGKKADKKADTKKSKAKTGKQDKKSGGGFLGGLFGKKK
ncbi:MAG: DnaJ domain-containing protein [Oscillatoria sp. SIO1A7]|nr:DnaJ domain-containing protein [Oscillatoria sp. SIO1A7]